MVEVAKILKSAGGGEGASVSVRSRVGRELETKVYGVRKLASDFGEAWRWKRGRREYDVLFEGGRWRCECKGYLARGDCKHLKAMRRFAGEGLLHRLGG
jgi:hypothetical protein